MILKYKKIILWVVVAVLLLGFASVGLAYFTNFTDPVTKTFKRIYPQAIIEGEIISINDIDQAVAIGQSFGLTKAQAKDSFIAYQKSLALAKKLKLTLNSNTESDELLYYTSGKELEYRSVVESNYGGSERLFNKYFVWPQMVSAQLRIKYYNDTKSGNSAYKQAQEVLEKLKSGQSFESLAAEYSQDEATANLGGDLGFYEHGQVLPELDDQISISTMGEYRKDVIVSRLGYHVVLPVEQVNVDGKKLWHAKHILFTTDGYETWLNKQLAGIKEYSIIK